MMFNWPNEIIPAASELSSAEKGGLQSCKSAVQMLLSETALCNIRTLLIAHNSAFRLKCRWTKSVSDRSWCRLGFKVA